MDDALAQKLVRNVWRIMIESYRKSEPEEDWEIVDHLFAQDDALAQRAACLIAVLRHDLLWHEKRSKIAPGVAEDGTPDRP